jgi:hypothetical protein
VRQVHHSALRCLECHPASECSSRLAPHLEMDELERRYRAAKEPHERSWWQLARGQTATQISETTGGRSGSRNDKAPGESSMGHKWSWDGECASVYARYRGIPAPRCVSSRTRYAIATTNAHPARNPAAICSVHQRLDR